MSKTAYVIIKIVVDDDADVDEIVSDMYYSLEHEEIADTEVMGVSDEYPA